MFEEEDSVQQLSDVHGILVPGGFGERGAEGKIRAVRFAREHNVPYFGICFGMQMALIETAPHIAGPSAPGPPRFSPPGAPAPAPPRRHSCPARWGSSHVLSRRPP